MKSKKTLKVLYLLLIISIVITLLSINSTYAKYYEQMNTNYEIAGIKRWNIKINEKDIYNETSLNNIMQPIFIEDENMKNNILVPGREGYFEIEIDFTKVDVPFIAEFTIEQITSPMLLDFELYGYSVRQKGTEIVEGEEEIKPVTVKKTATTVSPMVITENFDPTTLETDEEKVQVIRAHIRWNDDTGAVMNNQKDTDYRGKSYSESSPDEEEGIEHTVIEYNATLNLTQNTAV